MVGYGGSPTYTVYVDVTLTRSKVKVKELPTTSEAVHAGGDDCSPLVGLSGFNFVPNQSQINIRIARFLQKFIVSENNLCLFFATNAAYQLSQITP